MRTSLRSNSLDLIVLAWGLRLTVKHYLVELNSKRYDVLKELCASTNAEAFCGDANVVLPTETVSKVRYEEYERAYCLLAPYDEAHLPWEIVAAANALSRSRASKLHHGQYPYVVAKGACSPQKPTGNVRSTTSQFALSIVLRGAYHDGRAPLRRRRAGDWSRHHLDWATSNDLNHWPIRTLQRLGLDVRDHLLPPRVFKIFGFDIYSSYQVAAVDGFRALVRSWDIDRPFDPTTLAT
jgi:hypothetical protein